MGSVRTRFWSWKITISLLAIIALALTACRPSEPAASDPLRILFIGNSYTFQNGLPNMVAALFRSEGCNVEVEILAPGGWTLADHAASNESLNLIASGSWDYVVLQEQSVIPALYEERKGQMYPAARVLDERIQAGGAETVLFMTWGRKHGLATQGFPDYASMQTELSAGTIEIAEELGALVAPVGIAWGEALAQQPDIALWELDGSHPSETGSYLAACVLYTTIRQRSPEGAAFHAGLVEERALFLQRVATEAVLAETNKRTSALRRKSCPSYGQGRKALWQLGDERSNWVGIYAQLH